MTDLGDRLTVVEGNEMYGVVLSDVDIGDRVAVIKDASGKYIGIKSGTIDIGDRVLVVGADTGNDNINHIAFLTTGSAASTYWIGPTGATGYCFLKLCTYDFNSSGTVWQTATSRKLTSTSPTINDNSDDMHRDKVSSDCWMHYFRSSTPTEYYMKSSVYRLLVLPPPKGELACYSGQHYIHFDIKGSINTSMSNYQFFRINFAWKWGSTTFNSGFTLPASFKTDGSGNWSSTDWTRITGYTANPASVLADWQYYDFFVLVAGAGWPYPKVNSANLMISHPYITTYSS
jgi:hypothetical protein